MLKTVCGYWLWFLTVLLYFVLQAIDDFNTQFTDTTWLYQFFEIWLPSSLVSWMEIVVLYHNFIKTFHDNVTKMYWFHWMERNWLCIKFLSFFLFSTSLIHVYTSDVVFVHLCTSVYNYEHGKTLWLWTIAIGSDMCLDVISACIFVGNVLLNFAYIFRIYNLTQQSWL